MQKQKKQKKEALRPSSKPKAFLSQQGQWKQNDFCQLYPEQPQIMTSATFFLVSLNYKGTMLKAKLPTGIENKNLPYIFHKQIYQYLLNMHDSNPLLKTAQIVGFQSMDEDVILDYQISIGKGVLTKKTAFNCIEYVPEGRLKKYKICKCLAIGGFSKVYLVRSLRDGQYYAMKVMLKKFISQNQKQNIIENQKMINSMLNHPFIVKLNHCFQTHNFVCFVLDYCPGGELFYYLKSIKRMSQQHARFYFIEILYGLMYLHQQNIIYRDLKPENLLINHDGHIKIADFGLSKGGINSREVTYSFCGSTQYMPPEMILKAGHSFGVDFYTLGALLYQLVTGLPPFYSRNQDEIKQSIINQDLTFPDHVELSSEIKSLLTGLLNKNPKFRLGSLRGLKEILFHPWIGKISSDLVLSKKLVPPYIPSLDQFNFDENELGDDEAEFTQALLQQSLIHPSKEKLIFKNFDFYNQNLLRPEVKKIYDSYKQIKSVLQHYSSSKSLRANNSGPNLKRQQSSPYLAYSFQKTPSQRRKKSDRKECNKSLDVIKSRNSNISSSFSKSDLKKKVGYNSLMNFKKPSTTNILISTNQPTKIAKQIRGSKMFKQNYHIESIMKNRKIGADPQFLKKKKIVYNYLKNF